MKELNISSIHKPRPNLSDFNPGRIRNRVITHTNGEFVYTNDADIVFLEQDYLARCVEEMRANPNTVLYRPFMRRLPVDEFVQFKKIARKFGTAMAVKSLDLSQEYIATLNGKLRKLRVFKKKSIYPKTFTAFEEDFQVYVSDEKNRGREPLFWNENRHCGGNLFRMEQFIAVGGYSEDFINWGCEDSDLQWKFSQLYDLHFFPEDLEVLHLDHPKGYFSPEMWVHNEKINKKRVKEGIEKVIERDRRNIIWMQP